MTSLYEFLQGSCVLVIVVVVVVLSVLAVAAAQYKHHGHAESYASVNQLSEKHEEYKHPEPVYIKHEYKQPEYIKHEYKQPEYIKHEYKQPEYKQPEPIYIKHEYKHAEPVYIKHEVPVKHVEEYKHEEVEVEHHSHPKYEFKYGVEDHHTGDHKDAKEERDGDVVKGEYSLLQPDGRKRTVHYTASKHGGFNAIVSYSGHAIHPEVKKAEPVHGHY